jgi:hypothetical protein
MQRLAPAITFVRATFVRATIARARRRGALALAASFGAALLLSGCGSTGGSGGMASFAQASTGPTLAFESIDGPPPQVFERLVGALNSEAQGKPILVVSRETRAAYHVRAYLSAQVRSGRSVIAWVFDAYDSNEQRALRLTGEEVAGKAGRDAWAAADDQVLRRIAAAGLSGLSAYLTGGQMPDTPTASPDRGMAVASADVVIAGTPDGPAPQALGFSAH